MRRASPRAHWWIPIGMLTVFALSEGSSGKPALWVSGDLPGMLTTAFVVGAAAAIPLWFVLLPAYRRGKVPGSPTSARI